MKHTVILKSNGIEVERVNDVQDCEVNTIGLEFVNRPALSGHTRRGFTSVPFGLNTLRMVANAMEQSGLGPTELARKIGVQPARVSEWSKGKHSMRLNEFFSMCNLLGLHPAQLIY